MTVGKRTYELPRCYVTTCFKGGSTSVSQWSSAAGIRHKHGKGMAPQRPEVAFIRDPVMRLQSAWRMFRHHHSSFPAPYRGQYEYPAFVDRVLSGYVNPHWNAQAEQCSRAHLLLPFEAMPAVWPLLMRGQGGDSWQTMPPLPHENRTAHYEMEFDYRLDELDRFYSDDLVLYERAHTLFDILREGFAPEALQSCEKERASRTRARTTPSTSGGSAAA